MIVVKNNWKSFPAQPDLKFIDESLVEKTIGEYKFAS